MELQWQGWVNIFILYCYRCLNNKSYIFYAELISQKFLISVSWQPCTVGAMHFYSTAYHHLSHFFATLFQTLCSPWSLCLFFTHYILLRPKKRFYSSTRSTLVWWIRTRPSFPKSLIGNLCVSHNRFPIKDFGNDDFFWIYVIRQYKCDEVLVCFCSGATSLFRFTP